MIRLSAIVTVLCVFASSAALTQVVLARQVVGTVGINGTTSSAQFSTTAGQAAFSSYESASFSLTEGFEQPLFSPLEVEAVVHFETCWNGANASIQLPLLSGCGGVESVRLDGEEVGYTMTDLAPGEYTLEVFGLNGCIYTEIILIEAPNLPPCDLNVYNVITPNSDGENDVFTIGNILHPSYLDNKVKILNRWGLVVWEGRNYDNVSVFWDGRDQDGKVLPEGTYFYEITLTSQTFTGFISLLP